jgi:RNA polymerase sigma-70 factor (ECF subfamily)
MQQMTWENVDDIQLLQMAAAGEEAAFVTLYRRWQGNLYRYSLRLSSSASIAEDVTQEVFLALMDGGSGFDPARGSFSSYAYGIARNHALRRMTRERIFAPIADDAEDKPEGIQSAWRLRSDPLDDLTQQERIDSLHRAVAALPLRYREVVVLCELQELSYAEAAQVIGCPEGTIRSRLHRARMLLLEKLQEMTKADSRAAGIEPARCLL